MKENFGIKLQQTYSHFCPKHTSSDVIKFSESFCKFKVSPSTSTYCNFLADYFVDRSISEPSISAYPDIVLKYAKRTDLLLDATLQFRSLKDFQSTSGFARTIQSAILSAIVPFQSTSSLYSFLNKNIPNLSLYQQVSLLKWVKSGLIQRNFPSQLPSLQSRSSVGILRDCSTFMKTLRETKRPLESPFLSVHLKIEQLEATGEIRGRLKIKMNKNVSGSSQTIEVILNQNSTYLLGFVAYVELFTAMEMKTRPKIPIQMFIDWTEFTKVLPGGVSMLSLVRKQRDRLQETVNKALPHSVRKLSAKLIETTINKDNNNHVWLNTVRPPLLEDGFLAFNKLVPAKHKKPSNNPKLPRMKTKIDSP